MQPMHDNDMANENSWLDVVSHKLQEAEKQPLDGSWQAIEARMKQQEQASAADTHVVPLRSRRRLWTAVASAAAVIAIVVGVTLHTGTSQVPVGSDVTAQSHTENKSATTTDMVTATDEQTPATTSTPAVTHRPNVAQQLAAIKGQGSHLLASNDADDNNNYATQNVLPTYKHENNDVAATADASGATLQSMQTDAMPALGSSAPVARKMAKTDDIQTNAFATETGTVADTTRRALMAAAEQSASKQNSGNWQSFGENSHHVAELGNHTSANSLSDDNTDFSASVWGSGVIMAQGHSQSSGTAVLLNAATNWNDGVLLVSSSQAVEYEYSHHIPVNIGLVFSKRITGQLYGTFGLTYSGLYSDVSTTNSSSAQSFSQHAHFIGIPVGLKWNFWHNDHFDTYVGGEAQIERCIDAKFGSDDITVKRLQWSLHALLGAQYKITERFGLFAEPKVSHYITEFPLVTIRNEHPLNLNIQFGARINF